MGNHFNCVSYRNRFNSGGASGNNQGGRAIFYPVSTSSVSERGRDEQPTHYRRMREALKYSLPPPQREASFCMSFVRAYTYASDHRVVGGPRKKREGFLWPSIKCRGRKGRKERGGGTEPVINLCEAKRPFRQGRVGGYKSATQELVYGISMHFMP